jgi:sulfatase maturation enzyme AslB (radical SAM superfamily)
MNDVKRHYLFLDLGFYSACNLKCSYCREEVVKDKKDFHLNDLIHQVETFRERFKAGVVKLSGYGEVTMWADFSAALDYLSPKFPQVQVISNGTFDQRVADEILKHPNVSVNLTIDGHTMEYNAIRVQGNKHWHERMLRNLKYFVSSGRAVEVNCVLNAQNVGGLASFCEYLSEIAEGRIMLFPFPVKSFDRAREAANPMKKGFAELSEMLPSIWNRFSSVLPPKPYVDDLKNFLARGMRSDHCHIHWANLGTGSRNERLHCANYGEDLSYGPMLVALTRDAEQIRMAENTHLQTGHVGPRCENCFNHFHVINLFLEGRINLAELQTLPSLQAPGIAPIAKAMKTEFHENYGRSVRAASREAVRTF